MPPSFTRTPFTWLSYVLLALYGYFLNILGPITPFLKDELQLNYTLSSLHFTAFAAGIIVVGLVGGPMILRLGLERSLWAGGIGISLGAILLSVGRSPVITIGAAFVMGVIGSLILAIVPSALADEHAEYRAVALSEANSLASLVGMAAPLLVGWFAATVFGWRFALLLGSLTIVFLGFSLHRARAVHQPMDAIPLGYTHGLPALYWVYWIVLVLGVSVEFCMIYWSADYFSVVLGLSKANAALVVSLFLCAMIIGRLAASKVVRWISPSKWVGVSIIIALTGFTLYWTAANAVAGAIGLFVTGLGVAGLYPLLLSLALGASGRNTVEASSRATLASGTAILILPLVLGRLADAVGIHQAYVIVAILLITAFGLNLVANALRQPHPLPEK